MGPDFSQLYSLLGLEPGCSLEELKRAYRKRVAELHPDRSSPGPRGDERSVQLARLIPLYKDAVHFHEVHGRLPGSTVAEVPAVRTGIANPGGRSAPPTAGHSRGGPETPAIPASHWLLLLALACLIGYLVFSAFAGRRSAPDSSATAGTHPSAARVETASQDGHSYVLAGMDADTVLAIQGPPSRISDDVWEYGPSWLRFQDGRLVEWHSSPLYRLKTRTSRGSVEQ